MLEKNFANAIVGKAASYTIINQSLHIFSHFLVFNLNIIAKQVGM